MDSQINYKDFNDNDNDNDNDNLDQYNNLEQDNSLVEIDLTKNNIIEKKKTFIDFFSGDDGDVNKVNNDGNYVNKNDNENNNENDNENENANESNMVDTINLDVDTGPNFIYDIIRYFNEIYASGRIHIENNYFNLASNEDFNLVYPNVYIGNYSITTNLELLKGLGITHIISVIPTFNPAFEDKFKYLHIQAYDDEYQDITKYLNITNEFIKNCLMEKGKVLIHCMVGRSRSVSIFIGFLISIIKGEFTQSIVNLHNDINTEINSEINNNMDLSINNMIEYKKLIENNSKFTKSQIKSTYIDNEKISTNPQELPKLSKKEENFIIYKKQKMFSDIEEIASNYNLLLKELNNFKKTTFVETEETQEIYENMKDKFASKIFTQLFKYIKLHRECAMPNNSFINQLCKLFF